MNEIIHILDDKEHYDAKTRAYMTMALGRFRTPEAEEALLKALRGVDDSEDPQLGIFLIWTLGNALGPSLRGSSPSEAEAISESQIASSPAGKRGGLLAMTSSEVARFLESKHDDLRKTAAYVLGALGDKKVTPALKRSLEDPVVDVKWNATLSLARLGDSSGKETLLEMLDRNRLRTIREMNEAEIEQVMTNAAKGLGLIQDAETRPILENLAKTDPSLKVRQAALTALNHPQ